MVSIPLSEVEIMMIEDKEFDLGKTFLALLATATVVGIGFVVLVLPSMVGN